MTSPRYSFVICGLSITSSWGNGHATTYRALVRSLVARGHDVLFLERDLPFYRAHRDLARPGYGVTELYESREELEDEFTRPLREADVVILGSYVPEGPEVARWMLDNAKGYKLFYDIDTPITLRALAFDECQYMEPSLVPRFDVYLSFTGGPTLARIERIFGARRARPLYCSVDPELYFPEDVMKTWDLGYLGTFSPDRKETVERLVFAPARALPSRQFIVAGAQYPADTRWPENVRHVDHVPPGEHRAFYNRQRFALSTTRWDMITAGHSPSVRLFEAAACGTPIISDDWTGIECFFEPGREIFVAHSAADVESILKEARPEDVAALATRARRRVLAEHTAGHRAEALEAYVAEVPRPGRAGRVEVTRGAATNEAKP